MPLSHASLPSSRPVKTQRPGRDESDDEGNDLTEDKDGYISVGDALKAIWDDSVQTRAPNKVENAIWDRISR